MRRAIAVAVPTIVSVFALATPASGPPLPPSEFYANARLDTTQVIDPGPCTLRTFRLDGIRWAYCEERPTEVEAMLPIIDWE